MGEIWEIYRSCGQSNCAWSMDVVENYIFLREHDIVDLAEYLENLSAAIDAGNFSAFGEQSIIWLEKAYKRQLKDLPEDDEGFTELHKHLLEKLETIGQCHRFAAQRNEKNTPHQKEFPPQPAGPAHRDLPFWWRKLREKNGFDLERMLGQMKHYAEKPGAALEKARIRLERERARGEVAEMVQH